MWKAENDTGLPVGLTREVAAVGASPGHPAGDSLTLSDDVFDGPLKVGEGRSHSHHPLVEPLTSRCLLGDGVVIDNLVR
jgi:hypothetical protein